MCLWKHKSHLVCPEFMFFAVTVFISISLLVRKNVLPTRMQIGIFYLISKNALNFIASSSQEKVYCTLCPGYNLCPDIGPVISYSTAICFRNCTAIIMRICKMTVEVETATMGRDCQIIFSSETEISEYSFMPRAINHF